MGCLPLLRMIAASKLGRGLFGGPTRATPWRVARVVVACTSCVVAIACSSGERVGGPTIPPGGPTDTTGVVRRYSLDVKLTVSAPDSGIAARLGLAASRPRGVEVFLLRDGATSVAIRTALTDALGVARFDGLLEGRYSLAVSRHLTSAERDALSDDARDVTAFAGGATATISSGNALAAIELVAGRSGSLVLSEIWPHRPVVAGNEYGDGGYVELYNNSDTVIYLDGMLVGALPPASEGRVPLGSTYDYCGAFRGMRQDTLALHAMILSQIPGRGRDYPLAAGRAAVIAQDAIDHRAFATDALDLSASDFELLGDERDVDNPASPNMRRILGTVGVNGRGWRPGFFLPDGYFVARRPVESLDTVKIDNLELARIPSELVLDAVFLYKSPEARTFSAAFGLVFEDCDPGWSLFWERAPARLANIGAYSQPKAFVRRASFTRSDGRTVLQRTRASARDWVYGPPASPGVVQ